jgi:hypothetical protein
MASNASWHLFFSYNWGKNNINIEKVRQIHDRLKQELSLEIWWDQTHLDEGNWVKKITNGVRNSELFISFITRDYSESENCMKELEMAKNLGKEILFFINEDTKNMSHEKITNDIFKDAVFFLGTNLYYKTPDDLVKAVKAKLGKKTVRTNIYLLFFTKTENKNRFYS